MFLRKDTRDGPSTDIKVVYIKGTIGTYQCILHMSLFLYLKCVLPPVYKRAKMHGQDTLPLHGKNLSVMNQTNGIIVETIPLFPSSTIHLVNHLHWRKWKEL